MHAEGLRSELQAALATIEEERAGRLAEGAAAAAREASEDGLFRCPSGSQLATAAVPMLHPTAGCDNTGENAE